jgi:tetratricopeptide (TPR) repeat protein
MAESSRIEDLRRRIQKDPASIAFAQLAEELRRARHFEESVETCRVGLAIHPGYLSARVTLGRALVELNDLDAAQAELEQVLASAPENLAAIRGLAEINHRNGDLAAALAHYRAALALAKNDPDLQETVSDLSKKVDPPKPPASADGLTLEQVTRELSIHLPPVVAQTPTIDLFSTPAAPAAAAEMPVAAVSAAETLSTPAAAPDAPVAPADFFAELAPSVQPSTTPDAALAMDDITADPAPFAAETAADSASAADIDCVENLGADPTSASAAAHESLDGPPSPAAEPVEPPSTRVIGALEQWLEAIHVTREQRGA